MHFLFWAANSANCAAAVECMAEGSFGVLVGMRDGEIRSLPLAEVVSGKKELDLGLLDLVEVLAR